MSFGVGFGQAWAAAGAAKKGDTEAFAGIAQQSIASKAQKYAADKKASVDRLGVGMQAAVQMGQTAAQLAGQVADTKARKDTALTMLDKQIAADKDERRARGLSAAAVGGVQALGSFLMPKIEVPKVELARLPMVEIPPGMSTAGRKD